MAGRDESGERWRIQFFRRHEDDDPDCSVPAINFLTSLPVKVAAEIHAVLDAVAAAPPPSFSGGGKWEAMREELAGVYEDSSPGWRSESPTVLPA